MSTWPSSGRIKPHKTFSSVVLPAPFGPMTPSDLAGGNRERHGVKRGQAAEAHTHAADLKY